MFLHEFICSIPDEHAEALCVKVSGAETRETIGEQDVARRVVQNGL
jgi:hypothetical protein